MAGRVRACHGCLRRTAERRGRNGLFGRLLARISKLGRLRDVRAVFEPHLQNQARRVQVDDDARAEIAQLVPVLEPAARTERFAIDRHRLVAADGLHEGRVVEHVEHHHRRSAGTGQAQFAVAAGADANRQTLGVYLSFTFDIPDE